MIIPLDYRNEKVIQQHEHIWHLVRPNWRWPLRHPYVSEYAWSCDKLAQYLRVPPYEARVMDAGGGSGSMQHFLAANYKECVNVDVSPKHLHPDATPSILVTSDLENTPDLEPLSFDGILAASSLEHNSWDKFLRVVHNLLGLLRHGAPLVATVPIFPKAHYYPAGGWPKPEQKSWAECYLFDADSFRELKENVSDIALWVDPIEIPSTEGYRKKWDVIHQDMICNSPRKSRYPYLSAGFVLIRR